MLIVLSFDGVKDSEFEAMAADKFRYPNIALFMKNARYTGKVKTIFVSNTYPIHTSISTCSLPKDHGIYSNISKVDESGYAHWMQHSNLIKKKTIFETCAEKGLKVGSICWPVTCGAKEIKYNLPEVHIKGRQSRILQHLKYGSPLFQLKSVFRHGHLLDGRKQPQLDAFLTATALDIINKVDLMFLHLLAYDFICHAVGPYDPSLDTARESLDKNLGKIMAAAPSDATIIVFSDHGHLKVDTAVDLYKIYGRALFEQCGGCAFFNTEVPDLAKKPWFGRMLRADEMDTSGYASKAAVGIAARPGFCFGTDNYRGSHGYPADYSDYSVFYAVKNGKERPVNFGPLLGDVRDVGNLILSEIDTTPSLSKPQVRAF